MDTMLQLNNDRFLEQESLNVDVASFQLPATSDVVFIFLQPSAILQEMRGSSNGFNTPLDE